MNTLATEPLCKDVRFDSNSMWVELSDGRRLGVPLSYFPRLLRATPAQRKKFIISGGGIGIHWDQLDEDISVAGLVMGRGDHEASKSNNSHLAGKRATAAKPRGKSPPPNQRARGIRKIEPRKRLRTNQPVR